MSVTAAATVTAALPATQPDDPGARLMLFGIRQMGAHGLNDASAAHAFVIAFGKDFRRPLVLLRALMADMAAIADSPIAIAPWCCPRITGAEATLLAVLGRARTNPRASRMLLRDLLGIRDASGVFATARVLANSFADLGLPLGER
jgi:hypothetical protein